MQANDILLAVRSRLNDTTAKAYRWSDEELIDMINSSLANMSGELLLFSHQEIYTIKENVNRYKLPEKCVKVISVNLDNQPVIIKSFDWMSRNKNTIDDDNYYVCMDEQSFFLYPEKLLKEDMKVEVNYNFIEQVLTKKDNIPISLVAKNALLFYTMHLAYQIYTSDKNTGKSTHYLNLYGKEIIRLKALYYKNRHSRGLRTPFRKV
ncbi:phage adaptor protein [Halarcobacter anaerophilus]|uniref:Uncharacterized protein n=1 Tax=Halarcobacter anaerophilus TaxID=877500 RepID=A0A4Q0Y314_9BACT|nr:hypothetical protein [Halarcobacter anaerophilus]QDF28989.1 hypothetical protein AANAER_1509 [Halarcobacter anaerophilus]RXJ63624.1 hypothetical protein CRV06_05370 [Halarcobacter anaerophilus]